MADCLFCKIIAGELPSFKVYEDGETFALLDINPAALGHTLVLPKKHAKDIFEIDEQSMRAVAATVKRIADKMHAELGADVSVLQNSGRAAGQMVTHLHVHVIPRKTDDRIVLAHIGPPAAKEALTEMQKKLQLSASASPAPTGYANRVKEAMSDWDRL